MAPADPAPESTTGTESDGDEATTQRGGDAPTVEEVTYPSGDLQLEGDLHVPAGPGPRPAVILIHGSGPNSRQAQLPGQLALQFGFAIPVFDELAAALSDAGWTVLTYDKRTCGTFNACATNAYPLPDADLTTEAFAADARAGVDYLRTRSDVDPEVIVVAGRSQGSTFVPSLLASDPRLRGGIMLAAPYDSVDQMLAARPTPIAAARPSSGLCGREFRSTRSRYPVLAAARPSSGLCGREFGEEWVDRIGTPLHDETHDHVC